MTGHTIAGVLFLILLLLVFFGMGYTIVGCSFGPAPDSGNRQPDSGSRFKDNVPMVAPILLCMLLTVLLGIHTPEFLADWIDDARLFLQQQPID